MYKQGLINETAAAIADGMYDACKVLFDTHSSGQQPFMSVSSSRCSYLHCTTAEVKLGRSINPYDVRQPRKVPPLCYDRSGMTKFLSRSDVRVDLGVGNYSWEQCNRLVEVFLLANWVRVQGRCLGCPWQ